MVNCSRNLSAVIPCETPDLEELATVIRNGLEKNFAAVSVGVTKCPDLTAAPFHMVQKHFGSGLRVAEVGGPGNLLPKIEKEKEFNLKDVCTVAEASEGSAFGPGAGPWPHVGTCCEMVADYNCKKNKTATKIAKIVEKDERKVYKMEIIDNSTFSLMANLAVSKNSEEQVDVLHIRASIRKGPLNFPESIRQAVAEKYETKTVSLAGLFILHKGKAKLHVMPQFPGCPFENWSEIDEWLHYFDMSAPLICATVMHSHDNGHKLRMEHTHCYSEHGDAGHYHYDVTPEEVEYEAWFAPAEKIYRIDEV